MFDSPTAQFYGRVYLDHILRAVESVYGQRKIRVLSIGCGHGRDTIPFAKLGHEVWGVDKNPYALNRAKSHAREEGVSMEFRDLDIFQVSLGKTFDLLLAIETLPGTFDEVERLVTVATKYLDAGGLLAVSIYTRFYRIMDQLNKGNYLAADEIAEGSSQPRWLHPSELKEYLNSHGYKILDIAGVGIVSTPRVDAHGNVPVPDDQLNDEKREQLFQIEMQLSSLPETVGCGRRVLAIAQKTG
jgi:2-polyprenyl-3-methyl-5-hydroxy-6-metoxy-1,4-benzoquinol methylase